MAILQSKVTVELEWRKPFEGVSYIIQGLVNVDLDGLPLVVARDSNVDNALLILLDRRVRFSNHGVRALQSGRGRGHGRGLVR